MEWKDQQLVKIGVLKESVENENFRQIAKWGVQVQSPFEWQVFLMEEVGELSEAICDRVYQRGKDGIHASGDVYKEAIQVATLALKIAEMASNTDTQEGE